MSERDSLRIVEWCDKEDGHHADHVDHYREATDADLAAMGYVKLDVDVADLRKGIELHSRDHFSDPSLIKRYLRLARQVLAALDGEDT